jgi:hypothetical protein
VPIGMLHTLPVIGVVGVSGRTDTGEPYVAINGEIPQRIEGFPEWELTKETLERFHLESFRADHVLLIG